jgi:hypothetical protein
MTLQMTPSLNTETTQCYHGVNNNDLAEKQTNRTLESKPKINWLPQQKNDKILKWVIQTNSPLITSTKEWQNIEMIVIALFCVISQIQGINAHGMTTRNKWLLTKGILLTEHLCINYNTHTGLYTVGSRSTTSQKQHKRPQNHTHRT